MLTVTILVGVTVKSLCFILGIDIILFINYTSLIKKETNEKSHFLSYHL